MSAGKIAPSPAKYTVTDAHDHATLNVGDVVVMTMTPGRMENQLFRFSDCTLHELADHNDQYVHLKLNE